jgi:hypothetical protein
MMKRPPQLAASGFFGMRPVPRHLAHGGERCPNSDARSQIQEFFGRPQYLATTGADDANQSNL